MNKDKGYINFMEIESNKLKVRIYEDRHTMGKDAAYEVLKKIKELLQSKPEINILFASAPSQNEFLEVLAENKGIEWERINAFHLDEYIGIDENAPQNFGKFLKDRLFSKVKFKTVNFINGNDKDIEGECVRYSRLLEEFNPDIACIGIGENGHIAFNDPHVAKFDDEKLVKTVELDYRCRLQQVNEGCFDSIEKVPVKAITLTIPAIMSAASIFCMVPGEAKAEAVYGAVRLEVNEACPASILRKHNNAILYTDNGSARRLL